MLGLEQSAQRRRVRLGRSERRRVAEGILGDSYLPSQGDECVDALDLNAQATQGGVRGILGRWLSDGFMREGPVQKGVQRRHESTCFGGAAPSDLLHPVRLVVVSGPSHHVGRGPGRRGHSSHNAVVWRGAQHGDLSLNESGAGGGQPGRARVAQADHLDF